MDDQKALLEKRKNIDKIDQAIMNLLDKRFAISREIKVLKNTLQLSTYDPTREEHILSKAKLYNNSHEISNVYQTILDESKKCQSSKAALIGGRLDYSFSDVIHQYFGNDDYQKIEMRYFHLDNNINHYNITNPFKKAAYNLCTYLSKQSLRTNVVNVISYKNQGIYGDNLDFEAFQKMVSFYNLDFAHKNVLIIGNGSTSCTIKEVLADLKVSKITSVVRTSKNPNEIIIEEFNDYDDYQVIINTSSYNVYPNIEIKPLLEITKFNHLECVIDINYQPLRSILMLKAQRANIPTYNGLLMLIENARLSENLWFNRDIDFSKSLELLPILNKKIANIVLIGMPLCGKTTIGKFLSYRLKQSFYDTDELLRKKIPDFSIITSHKGREQFRECESGIVKELNLVKNSIIATGGGIIENSDNLERLAQNGLIFFLDTPLSTLEERIDVSRPLLKDKNSLFSLYQERIEKYRASSDIIIETIGLSTEEICDEIMEKFYEYYDN